MQLGDKARDVVTGFTGIITGHAEHISGCDTYGLQPPVNDKGESVEIRWFDENRIEVLQAAAVTIVPVAKDRPLHRATGGPQDAPKPTR